jgi:hypothetical protein
MTTIICKKNVCFANNDDDVFVFEGYADGEVEAVWYTSKEMKSIRQDMMLDVRNESFNSRGLELFDAEVFSSSKKRRRNYVKSILSLQTEHRSMGLADETGLQRLGVTLSMDDLKQAQFRASQDSIEAFQVHTETFCPQTMMKAKTAEEYSKKTRTYASFSRKPKRIAH